MVESEEGRALRSLPFRLSATMEFPVELAQLVVEYAPPATLTRLALVSPLLRAQSRRALYANITLNSSAAVQLLLRSLRQYPSLSAVVKQLTLERGNAGKLASAGKRKAAPRWIENAITEGELVQLVAMLPALQELHLRELAFVSLRRRSLGDLTSHLGALHTLSIAGRPPLSSAHASDTLFNLHTVGQIVVSLPQLRHLSLRHIHASPTSLQGLTFPTFALTSFALFSTPDLIPHHLHWLLRATSHAETMRTLALDWDQSPRILNPIRYAALRVEQLALTTSTPGVVEAFVLHCPSLKQLTLRASVPVNAARLLGNLEERLSELVDKSEGPGCGVDARMLGLIIAGGCLKQGRKLRRLSIVGKKAEENRRAELVKACAERQVIVTVEQSAAVVGDDPWIPEE